MNGGFEGKVNGGLLGMDCDEASVENPVNDENQVNGVQENGEENSVALDFSHDASHSKGLVSC